MIIFHVVSLSLAMLDSPQHEHSTFHQAHSPTQCVRRKCDSPELDNTCLAGGFYLWLSHIVGIIKQEKISNPDL